MDLTRRHFVGFASVTVAGRAFAADKLIPPTPTEVIGPFYPVIKPVDRDADLTRTRGRTGRAKGHVIEVTGRVLNRRGEPVRRARIELWQANAAGRYTHPSDDNLAPLDPAFDGYAAISTGANGEFRILTVKPGGYSGGRRGYRTPHLHFDVAGRVNRMITQMYFPDELGTNASDQLLGACIDPAAVIAKSLPSRVDGVGRYNWDIILRDG